MAQGDLISILCRWGLIPYRHYAIDVGDNMVVHLATLPMNKKQLVVQRVPIQDFAEGKTIRVEQVKNSLPTDVVVQRALEAVGRDEYHFVHGNCEHFARDCKSDCNVSYQVDRSARSVIRVALVGAFASTTQGVGSQIAQNLVFARTISGRMTGVSSLVGEAVRHSAYAMSRGAKLEHGEAEVVGKTAGIAAAAITGTALAGPAAGVTAAAVYAAIDGASTRILDRMTNKSAQGNNNVG